jgi:hypothetical protein
MWHPVTVAKPLRAVVFGLCLAVHGCVDVNGGAVELSWKLRAETGSDLTFLDCVISLAPTNQVVEVSQIQLDWRVGDEVGVRRFLCNDEAGATKFEVPAGQAFLHVTPICPNNVVADPATFSSPPPEQREVNVGDTVSLGAIEILVEVSSCDLQPCICQ